MEAMEAVDAVEASAKGTTQEDLSYIQQHAGYALAKSLLWTIKTDTAGKVKVEWSQNFRAILLSCYILLGYDYSLFGAQNNLEDAEWGQLSPCVNAFLIDKLTSFDPLLSFGEKPTEELLQMDALLDEVSSSKKKKAPPQMESITTFGLTLLGHFNQVTKDILKAILKVKEEQPASAA
ncbi:hypothetical protein PVNG_05169 [Plasmodium vivax North Korean]|uniref:Uncharacterized protein n=1 Tax=Plasmodium vivax North Korean TaxID=1035514 RepID=A0A0J9WDF1_PLAVI|nr:hypothetical protein PVNG_05169 [Plasmodium vivax North Korean]